MQFSAQFPPKTCSWSRQKIFLKKKYIPQPVKFNTPKDCYVYTVRTMMFGNGALSDL